jgi:hypothetical protein
MPGARSFQWKTTSAVGEEQILPRVRVFPSITRFSTVSTLSSTFAAIKTFTAFNGLKLPIGITPKSFSAALTTNGI